MSTALAQQLQKLAAPQSSVTLADARSRASILFDPKEAATKDRRSIYEIGLTGLQELTDFNPAFKEFQLTLFDEATLTLERSVELPEINKMLDAAIAKFLRLLSPYLLLRPAHMAFEWLLRRFQVHEYNRSEVMALILPYHETMIFVQIVKTMRLRSSDGDWYWLRPLQRPGVPLAKTAIINRAASNPAFLGFICQSTQKAVKELGPRAHQLQAQINFYATVVVGALQTAKPLQDWHITTILESLLRGLISDNIDFMAAAYVIVAQLVSRTKLKSKVCNALLERVANCPFERLHSESLLLLVCIYGKQQAALPHFKPETILNLVGKKWLISTLSSLAKGNIAIQSICMPLMTGAVAAIRDDDASSNSCKLFLDNLLSEVPMPKPTAQQLINCFLDTYVETAIDAPEPMETNSNEDDDTIVIDSDDEIETEKTTFQAWYSTYLEKLERRYPEAFDLSVKEALRSKSSTSNRQKALKLALGFRLNTTDEKAKHAYEKLYHYSADWRLSAVQKLLQNLNVTKKRERSVKLLQECLPDRINDDSGAVVSTLLSLPTEELAEMLGPLPLAQTLCHLLYRAQSEKDEEWQPVVPLAVRHLTSALVSGSYDTNLVLLALMPLLFPGEALAEHQHKALRILLGSDFVSKVPFLAELKVSNKFSDFNVGEHRQHFLDIIASSNQELSSQERALLQSVEDHGGELYIQKASQLTHLLLLLTAYAKRELQPRESLHMLEKIGLYSRRLQFRVVNGSQNTQNCAPLQLYVDFLLTLVKNTKWTALASTPWNQMTDELRLCLRLLEIICAQVFSEKADQPERQEWTRALQQSLQLILPEAQDRLEVLSNFYVFERLPELWPRDSDYAVFRLQGFIILEAVLSNPKSQIDCGLVHVLRVANACGSPLQTLRVQAINILQLISNRKLVSHVEQLVRSLLQRKSELSMDHEQYALILYTILEPEKATAKERLVLSKLKRSVLALASDPKQSPICTASLLAALKHVNDENFLNELLPLGLDSLKTITAGEDNQNIKQLPWPHSEIYKSVIERFEGRVALNVLLRKDLAWKLFEDSFAQYDTYVQLEQKLQPLPCVLLNSLTPETFEQMHAKHKIALIKLIVESATNSDNDSIFLASHRLLKRCRLDCQPLVPILLEMANTKVEKKQPVKRRSVQATQLDLTSPYWKQGMTLLELLEHKKQLVGAELLIPPLFELLQACLTMEEHSAAEYPKQLILSSLLHCCQTAQSAGVQLVKAMPESSFRIELVVQSLRNTRNPQTQQHALLFLTHCAGMYPQQVLHKIVEIFTFVGSTVARHDDAFSLHIIHNVVESIIPILLLNTGHNELVIPVLKVFADICTDVPVHRRLPLYATLFRVLEPKEHLWQFLCIIFESQVLLEQVPQKVSTDKSRLDFARELTLMFEDPTVAIQTCIRLLDYLAKLPATKSSLSGGSGSSVLSTEQQLFDVRTRTFKQLRHYKYLIMDFLSGISSCNEWEKKMKRPDPNELLPYYQEFILKTLAYVGVLNGALEAASETPSLEKFWRVLANHAHDVLDNAIGLLAPQHFISVITELLKHDHVYVRIKVMDLLVTKLSPSSDYFQQSNAEHFGVLFAPLQEIINGILEGSSNSAQQAKLQQTALHALQLLALRHGRDYIEECRSLLATLTKITKRRANVPKAVVGNVVLTLVEICASLKAHALAQLPKFAPQLTELLKEQVHQMASLKQGPDYVCSTLVTALHKLFKALPLFLGPYLVDIIGGLARLSVQLENPQLLQDKRTQVLKQKLADVWSAVAQGVEVRILVPSCAKAFSSLLEQQAYDELGHLMQQLLLQSVRHNSAAQLQPVQDPLSELFLQALNFRLQVRGLGLQRQLVSDVEASITETFVTWILKLSETSFRPMYSRVHKWALESTSRETRLTYFLLTNRIAEALKSLFVLFASDFVEDSSRLLTEHNSIRPEFEVEEREDDVDLLMAILNTLHHVFLYCSEDFINDHRFNVLMPPLVNQLENDLVLGNESLQQVLSNCIAQFAVATNDVMWKQLNSQVLLKTRTSNPEVRILAFNSCVAIARKLGESYAALLPETVPFIAELLEDEHQRVEKNTRTGVQELETILGESVQKYL
uniref:HEAT repeat-containing protein 1 homolog n=1 Tax=Drosophila melanogaster TaxID=7227 RepID=HEAT1_DROME|nr:lethal (2) k09022 [Drosophila melanogaster]Q9VM75.2 RecName: Full=HEAT repeat-containing protein 1 homolog [Drosophila melanogaster]AAF52447.2 lethal (2) k09022 [Drosophila melanogaster]|eukprot:NP_609079.2 lethal (2) k09022 [Drosophila melanogaster]